MLVTSRLLPFACLLAFSFPAHANAAPIALCKKKAGIEVREGQCKKRETQLAIDLVGPQGTAGAKGDKGDTGEPGPGALVVRDARGTLVGTVIALRSDKGPLVPDGDGYIRPAAIAAVARHAEGTTKLIRLDVTSSGVVPTPSSGLHAGANCSGDPLAPDDPLGPALVYRDGEGRPAYGTGDTIRPGSVEVVFEGEQPNTTSCTSHGCSFAGGSACCCNDGTPSYLPFGALRLTPLTVDWQAPFEIELH